MLFSLILRIVTALSLWYKENVVLSYFLRILKIKISRKNEYMV